MKQALTFTPPILSSTESKLNVEAFDASVEAFENHEYLKSFYALLDYINGDFRTKYGNVQGISYSPRFYYRKHQIGRGKTQYHRSFCRSS